LVVACLRYCDPRPEVDPMTGAVSIDARSATSSAVDYAALEHALRLAELWGGRVLALVAGSAAADSLLREAMAAGADVLRVDWRAGPGHESDAGSSEEYLEDLVADEGALAASLAAAIREVGEPALVICGDRSADRGTGALPAFLAHELGAVQALGLVSLTVDGGDLLGERRLPGGRRERLLIPRPAVCSVEAAGVRLRRASLPGTLAARHATVGVAAAGHLASSWRVWVGAPKPYVPRTQTVAAPSGSPRERLLALTGALVQREQPTLVGPVDAVHGADELLAFLQRSGYRDEAARSEPGSHRGLA